MAQPSYKNLLKRSRSSSDPAADHEEILQGIALACKARVADGSDVLFASQFWAGKGLQELSSVSHMAQIVTNNSIASKLIFSSDNIGAVTLARSPSYPFDSDKALIRWLLALRREGEAYTEHMSLSRRRKRAADHGTDAATQSKDAFKASLPSLASFPYVTVSEASSQDGSVSEPIYTQVSTECTPVRSHFCENPPAGPPGVNLADTSALQVPEKVEGASRALVSNAMLLSQAQVSSKTANVKHMQLETKPVTGRRSGCIARDKCPQFGLLSLCGRRREMEDTCTVEPDLLLLPCDALGGCHCSNRELCACCSFHFFGVYDGHGGTQASSFCKSRLHKAFAEELIKDVRSFKKVANGSQNDWSSRWRRVMEACFLKIDEEVGGVCPTGGCSLVEGNPSCCINPIAPDNVGTTAVVAVIGPCQIIVANCGDSRAVLCRGGNVVPLSRDHKPDRDDEMSRIVAAGGRIIYWDGYRVGGLLAMSRAIGDRFLKNYVIAVPEVMCIERTKEDECLILASDGLWDVVSSEMACDIARRRLRSQRRKCANSDNPSAEDTPAGAAAALLTKLAFSRGSKDNISVIVIDLKSHCKKPL